MTSLEIVVDELVVRGLPAEQARVAAAALEARLTELGSASEARLASRAEASRRLPAVDGSGPAGVGEAVAGAVWRAVVGGDERR